MAEAQVQTGEHDRDHADSGEHPKADAAEPADARHKAAPKRLTPRKRALLFGALIVALLVAAGYWYHGTFYEDTDDAQIDGHISAIAARVGGTVTRVLVEDNQSVGVGQLLVELDPTDLRVALDQARAALDQARAQLRAEQASAESTATSNQTLVATSTSQLVSGQAGVAEAEQAVAQAESQIEKARADSALAESELKRSAALLASGSISQAEYERSAATATSARAAFDVATKAAVAAQRRVQAQAAEARAASSRLSEATQNSPDVLRAKQAMVELRQASVAAAEANLKQAELNLDYANVRSAVKGIVGKRSVNVGDRVSPGQPLLAVTQIEQQWVTANFRETQVRRMQPGQRVSVHVDALDLDLNGRLESLAAATGSRYSVLPPENASGNYVKVVQRVPVRIALERGQPGLERLRPGMSVEPQVRVK